MSTDAGTVSRVLTRISLARAFVSIRDVNRRFRHRYPPLRHSRPAGREVDFSIGGLRLAIGSEPVTQRRDTVNTRSTYIDLYSTSSMLLRDDPTFHCSTTNFQFID